MNSRRRPKLSRQLCPRRYSWLTLATLLLLLLAVTSVTSTTGDELDTSRGTAVNPKPQTPPRGGFTDLDSPYRDAGYYKVDFAGDVIFGGLFPMHEKGVERSCGEIKKEKGIQRLEAMLYAVDRINEDQALLPDLKVGVRILDTCSYDTFALERCMDFIKAQLSSIDLQDYRCADDLSPAYHRQKPVAGVIGAASSTVSIMVANILRLFKIPQISYASTSSDLSDKGRFEYFSRVVPPDTYQAQAMVDIAKELQWKFVNTIAEEGTYGEKGIEAFEKAAKESGVCLARSKIIPRNAGPQDYEKIITDLLTDSNAAKVGVMFANEDISRRFVQALSRLNKAHELKLLASDSWGAKVHPVLDNEEAALGTITILVKRKDIQAFDDYFLNLTVANNLRNPWFEEFWDATFNCTLNGTRYKRRCSGSENLLEAGYKQEGLVQFVIDSVYSLAHAVHNYLSDHCPDGFYRCQHLRNITGEKFLGYIRNVSFMGVGGDPVKFNVTNGDGLGRYDIYQFQKDRNGTYKYERVGEWTDQLVLNVSQLQWKNGSRGAPPVSICSQPCKPGESKKKSSACCWLCAPCKDNEYLKVVEGEEGREGEEECRACDALSQPNANRTGCDRLPEVYILPTSFWFLIPAAFCIFGVFSTGFVLAVFIRYNNTPVIMASGRELCYLLLLGIFLAYLTAFIMLIRRTPALCAVIRLGVGVSLCFIYAGLLTKTNRIYRIFNVGIKAMVKRPSYTSPRSQILICTCLVSVQVVGGLTWLGFEKPDTEYRLHNRDSMVRECRASQIATMISLFYNMFLIVLCTVYAFKTRNIPQNFNEAKYIAFAMYSTCIVWSAFIPIYFGANHDFKIEVTSLCMCVGISATVSLFCLFAPKVYIVLFQPHKNVRQSAGPTSFLSGSGGGGGKGRSFYGPGPSTSSVTYPVQNGSVLRPDSLTGGPGEGHPQAGGGGGAEGPGPGGGERRVEVVNAFHDSLEDMMSDAFDEDFASFGGGDSRRAGEGGGDEEEAVSLVWKAEEKEEDEEEETTRSLQFMDQSPDVCCQPPALLPSLALPAATSVHASVTTTPVLTPILLHRGSRSSSALAGGDQDHGPSAGLFAERAAAPTTNDILHHLYHHSHRPPDQVAAFVNEGEDEGRSGDIQDINLAGPTEHHDVRALMAATVYTPMSAAVLAGGLKGAGLREPSPALGGRAREVYSPLVGVALGPALGLALDADTLLAKGLVPAARGRESPLCPIPDTRDSFSLQPGRESPVSATHSPRSGSRGSPHSQGRQGSRDSPSSCHQGRGDTSPSSTPHPRMGGQLDSPHRHVPCACMSPSSRPRSRESPYPGPAAPTTHGLQGLHQQSLDSLGSGDWPFSPLPDRRRRALSDAPTWGDPLLPLEPGEADCCWSDPNRELNRQNGNSPHPPPFRQTSSGSCDSNKNSWLTEL